MDLPTFSNPRKQAAFDDWPLGGSRRGRCEFEVEENKRGQRVLRRTEGRNGNFCKPKKTTYARAFVIVDCDNGKTYLLADNQSHITIWQSDCQHTSASVFPNDDGFETLRAFFSA